MSYTKQTWQSGDVITAAKLNHIEDGIDSAVSSGGGGVFDIFYSITSNYNEQTQETEDEYYINKTLTEINNAIDQGLIVRAISLNENNEPNYSQIYYFGYRDETDNRLVFITASYNRHDSLYPITPLVICFYENEVSYIYG